MFVSSTLLFDAMPHALKLLSLEDHLPHAAKVVASLSDTLLQALQPLVLKDAAKLVASLLDTVPQALLSMDAARSSRKVSPTARNLPPAARRPSVRQARWVGVPAADCQRMPTLW